MNEQQSIVQLSFKYTLVRYLLANRFNLDVLWTNKKAVYSFNATANLFMSFGFVCLFILLFFSLLKCVFIVVQIRIECNINIMFLTMKWKRFESVAKLVLCCHPSFYCKQLLCSDFADQYYTHNKIRSWLILWSRFNNINTYLIYVLYCAIYWLSQMIMNYFKGCLAIIKWLI